MSTVDLQAALKVNKYGNTINAHDLFKIIGLSLMIIDHIGSFIFSDLDFLRAIGRGAAPLFFFLIGYTNKLKISASLIMYGLILTVIGSSINHQLWINILINFIITHLIISNFGQSLTHKEIRAWIFVGIIILHGFVAPYIEYGEFGLLFAIAGRLTFQKDKLAPVWVSLACFLYAIWEIAEFQFMLKVLPMVLTGITIWIVATLMLNYNDLQEHVTYNKFGTKLGLIISRLSLHIYFWHLLALQLGVLYLSLQ